MNGSAAAAGDALAALAVNDGMVASFLVGHGVDDGLDALQARFVHLGVLREIGHGAELREHVHELFERAHFLDLAQLVAEVFEGKLVAAHLALELGGGLQVHGLFGALD